MPDPIAVTNNDPAPLELTTIYLSARGEFIPIPLINQHPDGIDASTLDTLIKQVESFTSEAVFPHRLWDSVEWSTEPLSKASEVTFIGPPDLSHPNAEDLYKQGLPKQDIIRIPFSVLEQAGARSNLLKLCREFERLHIDLGLRSDLTGDGKEQYTGQICQFINRLAEYFPDISIRDQLTLKCFAYRDGNQADSAQNDKLFIVEVYGRSGHIVESGSFSARTADIHCEMK